MGEDLKEALVEAPHCGRLDQERECHKARLLENLVDEDLKEGPTGGKDHDCRVLEGELYHKE